MMAKWACSSSPSSLGLRVLIVEDHPILRNGLKEILSRLQSKVEFGEASDAQTAARLLQRKKWDVMLLDINLPGRNGLELLSDIRRICPQMRVLVVSAYPEMEFAGRAFKLGARGYLVKNQAPKDLVAAVKKILAGGKYVSKTQAGRLTSALGNLPAARAPHDALSARELQMLRLIAGGKTDKDIVAKLALSEKTIATCRARIAEKTGLSTNLALSHYALQLGHK